MVKPLNIGGGANAPTAAPTLQPTFSPAQVMPASIMPAPAPMVSVPAISAAPGKLPVSLDDLGKIGGDAQGQLAQVTQKITGVAKTSDMEGMGKLVTDTLMAAKGYDPNKLFKTGFIKGLFGKAESLKMRFDTVDGTVQKLVAQVDQRVSHFRARVVDLEQLGLATEKFRDQMSPQIVQITQTADWMEQNPPAVDPTDMRSANFAQEWTTVISFARKRADDLRRAQILADQQVAQINQLRTNSIALAQKFSDIKITTIPALQNVFTAYVIAMEQKKGAEMTDQIDAMTDNAIKMGAGLMAQNTTQIHTSLTRSNISMSALQANYDSVTTSLTEVKRLQDEMKTRLATEAPQLEQLSRDLSARLSQR